MTYWFSQSLKPSRRVAFAAVGLSAVSLGSMGSRIACGAETTVPATKQEDSLLVATHKATPADASAKDAVATSTDGDSLEPVSQTSDHTPELATTSAQQEATQTVAGGEHSRTKRSPAPSRVPSGRLAASIPFEPVKFQGIQVGTSTKQEVIGAWGNPAESISTSEGEVLGFRIHPYQVVEVLVGRDEVVSAIKIALANPIGPEQLSKQLSLDEFRPVTVLDEEDEPLGQAFPERGVVFMFEASDADALADDGLTTPDVSHVVIQPLEAQAFALRAENCLHGPYAQNVCDLKMAIAIEPQFAHAYCLLAKMYLVTGQADLADAAAAEACEIEPNVAAYQLCRGQTNELLGEYDKAVLTVRAVLDRDDIAPIDKAQALYQMGRLASLGDVEIASKAIPFHTRAIDIADKCAASASSMERRAAKQLLIEAHLAVAEEVARQAFNDKLESLSQWIGRASGLAEDCIAKDGGSIEWRLVIAQRALGALASFRPTRDPAPWVKEAEEAAQALAAQSDDELWQSRLKWELGITYLNALRVEHIRRETAMALQYGNQAVEYLAEGAASRQAVHSSEQLVGQLYFQMGAVHAVHQLDHEKAAQWYDKAEPLLTGPRPVSELYAPRREGEMLVSMGVTYWQLGNRTRALDLTQNGVNLVEMAVEDGILAKTTLAVPYGNLATMYRNMGEATNAAKYAALTKSVNGAAPGDPPRLGRAPIGSRRSGVMQTNGQQSRPSAARR